MQPTSIAWNVIIDKYTWHTDSTSIYKRERERETDRQTDRQTEREREWG